MDLLKLWQKAKENVTFLLFVVAIMVVTYLVAYIAERLIEKAKGKQNEVSKTKRMTIIAMFSAIAVVLMLFEIQVGFAPDFFKIDLSEIPILICSFILGPVAGIMAEICKIVLKLFIKGTSTAFVGDFANFIIGCSFIVPASIIYHCKKNRKMAIIGVITGTLIMTIFGSMLNAVYLLPTFSKLFGLPLESMVAMGTKINGSIHNVQTLVLFSVVPLNLLKGCLVSMVTILIYKKISIIFK